MGTHKTTALEFDRYEMSKSIEVDTISDDLDEPDETFFVYITDTSNKLDPDTPTDYLAKATGTIRDDDGGPTPTPSISSEIGDEGESLVFTVRLDRPPSISRTYYYATYRETAGAGDYSGHGATALTFRPDERSRNITIQTMDDRRDEVTETFGVYITDAEDKLTADTPTDYLARGTGTIRDNDEAAPPMPRISDSSAEEGDSLDFTITLNRSPATSLTYYYATYRGSAGSEDYTGHYEHRVALRPG